MEFVGSGAKFTDLERGTLLLDLSNGSARFNSATFCGVCDVESRNNDSIQLKGNYFISTNSLGNHNLVVGGEDFTEQRYANNPICPTTRSRAYSSGSCHVRRTLT